MCQCLEVGCITEEPLYDNITNRDSKKLLYFRKLYGLVR